VIPVWLSNTTLAVLLAVCLLLIVAGYVTDRRAAIADARRRHPSSRGRA